jgi:hypothetical protein
MLGITDVEWKAYPAFYIDQIVASDRATTPDFMPMNLANQGPVEGPNMPPSDTESGARAASMMSVALTDKTRVGNGGTLAGIVADTGIPRQLLLADGTSVPFEQVGVLDEEHIVLGAVGGRLDGATALDADQVPERLDGAIPPGTVGQERRHDP